MSETKIPPFQAATIQAVAAILDDTDHGLSNAEIERVLAAGMIADPRRAAEAQAKATDPLAAMGYAWVMMSKRERIATAVTDHQERFQNGKALVRFITEAMKPALYVNYPDRHHRYRSRPNEVLILEGLKVNDKGQVAKAGTAAGTLSEAALLAGTLITELGRRRAHDMVFAYCTEEIIARDAFHAVYEAVKGICERLRGMTGSTADGHPLIDQALGKDRRSNPILQLNDLSSDTDWSEQLGLAHLIRALRTRYRNPTAHEARVVREAECPILERELLDVLTAISLVHHALDTANR